MPYSPEEQKKIAQAGRYSLIDFSIVTFPLYKPNWHHEVLAGKLEAVEHGEIKRLIVMMPPRYGKACALGTIVPTPAGYKKIEDLRVGEYVFGSDGKPTQIVAVSPIWENRKLYEVMADDGASVIVDEEHEWDVRLCRKRKKIKTKTTKYLAERRSLRCPVLKMGGSVEFSEKKLPIEPYVLGVWLGDGCSWHATITQGDNDIDWMKAEFEKLGIQTSNRKTKNSFGFLGLQRSLRKLGLINNKHIPELYLQGSIQQRINLLQGLIDTDGYVAPGGQVEFSSKRFNLADGVLKIVRSLGIKASMHVSRATLYGKDCGLRYRVFFYFEKAARLPRKAKNCRNNKRTPHRFLKFKLVGIGNTICIQVDAKDHQYLVGDGFILTHNSELVSIRFPAWFLGKNPQKDIIATSYNADLAVEFGGKTRDVIADSTFNAVFPEGIMLKEDEQAKSRWRTNKGGSYTSAGIGGPITGRGAHILLIDDPIKNREEAESQLIRDKHWDWYRSTAYTRLEKDAATVLVLTRWHLDDLAGRLLKEGEKGGEKWEVVKFPAIAIKDEIYRKQGEPLWPEKYSLADLEQTKKTVGIYNWSSLYQQEAILSEIQEFKPQYIKTRGRNEVEALATRKFLTIDTAYSQKTEADYCGIVKNYVDKENKWNLSAFRARLSPNELINLIFTLYQQDFYEKIGIEKTAYLAGLKPFLDEEQRKRNIFLPIVELEHKEVNKHTRIRGLLPRYESGSIFHLEGECSDLEEEMFTFPKGATDDVLDSAAYQLQIAESPENDILRQFEIQKVREERRAEFT